MAAPTPRPAKLRILGGVSPGRDSGGRLVPTPPAFERSAPDPPDWLSPEALAEWRRIVPALDALGVLKEADRAMVSADCETWSTYVTAIRQVRAEGVTVVNPETHGPRKNPALAAASCGMPGSSTVLTSSVSPRVPSPRIRLPPRSVILPERPDSR